ncbi:MAG TPA: sugar porter family MFS transporter, partial [Candidatus Desulfaltia sp.]|nr:sugar porter family MFS transporter [Candidatus Desulfaltia sp.]
RMMDHAGSREEEKMKSRQSYVIFVTVIAAIGGLLFGFDTAIVAGATRYLKDQFALTSLQEGWAVSVVLIGCMFGAGFAGTISDRLGRKRFMLVSAVLFFVSAIGCALPQSMLQFLIFRFVGGLGIGSASILAPLYIAEVSPARIRGALVSVNQMAIVTGILLAYFVNWAFAGVGPSNWRWMYGMGALPAVIFFVLLLRVPESPRWLVKQSREAEALEVLSRVNDAEMAAAEVRSIKETLLLEGGSLAELFRPGFRRALLIAVVLAIFQQITGINAILYYAPRIFERAGFERISAIGQSTIVGLVNMLFTIVAILLVDKVGRKPLLLIAAAGMGVSQCLLGAAFRIENFSGTGILLLILLYIAFFAMAMGPIVWVVMSEIFPTRMRGSAMAMATVALWVADFAVTLSFPVIADRLNESTAFWFYALMCALDLIFMIFFLPETKGKTLEEIERRWLKKA